MQEAILNRTSFSEYLRKAVQILKLAGIAFIALMLLLYPKETSNAAFNALSVFLKAVFPTVFPFMIVVKLILNSIDTACSQKTGLMNVLFGLPECTALPLILGTLSGYPMGARLINDLYEKDLLSSEEAQKASYFCVNCGPVYIISTVGIGFLGNISCGILAYACHLVIPLVFAAVGHALSRKNKHCPYNEYINQKTVVSQNASKPQTDLFSQAVSTCLSICGGIMFFAAVIACVKLLPLPETVKLTVELTAEISCGCKRASSLEPRTATALISALATFGDACILLQCKPYLDASGVKFHKFVLRKLLYSICAFMLCFVSYGILL